MTETPPRNDPTEHPTMVEGLVATVIGASVFVILLIAVFTSPGAPYGPAMGEAADPETEAAAKPVSEAEDGEATETAEAATD